MKYSILIFILSIILSSCSNQKNLYRKWVFELELKNQEKLSFVFDFVKPNKGILYNGKEEIKLDNIKIDHGKFTIPLHVFDASLKGQIKGGKIHGKWIKHYKKKPYEVNFLGYPHSGALDVVKKDAALRKAIQIAGKWEVEFENKGEKNHAIGLFQQEGDNITGSFLTSTGDYRFLHGKITANKFKLSGFDGGFAFLVKGTVKNNKIDGEIWGGKSYYSKWSALKNDQAKLPDPYKLTFLKEGYDSVNFIAKNFRGEDISLNSPKYKNKVKIVTIFGTWCPNCMDETAFFADWYSKNKDRGVEIISLAFERAPSFKAAVKQVSKTVKRYNVEYDMLIADFDGSKKAIQVLPMLNKIMSFPTSIIIDRSNKVRKIHTGFNGPGTGVYYEQYKKEFNAFMNELL
jgi:thiol-disulfide isomerase/thioredoxin